MIKVIPTIGPATEKIKDIRFLQNYTNIFRLNSSHNTIKWHKSISDKIKQSSQKNKILIDIPGIKPRTLSNRVSLVDILPTIASAINFKLENNRTNSYHFCFMDACSPK